MGLLFLCHLPWLDFSSLNYHNRKKSVFQSLLFFFLLSWFNCPLLQKNCLSALKCIWLGFTWFCLTSMWFIFVSSWCRCLIVWSFIMKRIKAMNEGYGACLINKPELVRDVVLQTRNRIAAADFSVSVKIRIHPDVRRTVALCQQVEHAGVSFLTVSVCVINSAVHSNIEKIAWHGMPMSWGECHRFS